MADVTVTREVRTDFTYSPRGLQELKKHAAEVKRIKTEQREVADIVAMAKVRTMELAGAERRRTVELERQRKLMHEQKKLANEMGGDAVMARAHVRRREEAAEARRRLVMAQREQRVQEASERVERRRAAVRRGFGLAGALGGGAAGMLGRGASAAGNALLHPATLIGGAGILGGVGYALKELINFRAGVENTELAMASLIRSADKGVGAFGDYANATKAAKQVIAEMREAAKTTPGSFEDVASAFNAIVVPGRDAGATLKQLADLSAVIASRQKLTGGAPDTIARDVRQMLLGQGGIGETQTPELIRIVNDVKKLVRSGRRGEALAQITNALALSGAERSAFGESFGGKMETVLDQAKELLRVFADPVFDAVKRKLGEWSEYLVTNKESALEMAKAFGTDLLNGLRSVGSALSDIAGFIGDAVDALGRWPKRFGENVNYVFGTGEGSWIDQAAKMWRLQGEAGLTAMRGMFYMTGSGPAPVGPARGAGFANIAGAAMPGPWMTLADLGAQDLINQARDASKQKLSVDARGARITIYQQIETDDPARIAAPSLSAAFSEVVRRPLSGRVGLANGG